MSIFTPTILTERDIKLLQTELERNIGFNGSMRRGQTLYNILFNVREDIAKTLAGANCDPFYNDSNIDAFLKRIMKKEDYEQHSEKIKSLLK